ncbi:YbbC/YhhH family protein [bacterium]|nr:YbbC/YhhH family protein [bacterium]
MSIISELKKPSSGRLVIILCALVSISLVGLDVGFGQASATKQSPCDHRPNEMYMPDDGCVPDKATAVRIAEAVWLPIYGKEIHDRRPFRAELIGDSVWAVAGSLPTDMLGGVPYIEIQRRDGKVLGVGHGE